MDDIELSDLESDARILNALVRQVASKGSATPVKDGRVAQQPGFVLHTYPYKETSLIVEVMTRDFGRLALVAKGAKRPHSKLRSVLQTFQPLVISWSGKSEIRTMTAAEWIGGMLPLEKSALLCGFYLNELMIKFCVRDQANRVLFDQYVATLNQLAHNESAAIVLRRFEVALLRQSGLLGDLHLCSTTRELVLAEHEYVLDPIAGVQLAGADEHNPHVLGRTLLDMQEDDYRDVVTQNQSKQLMRYLLNFHLNGQTLKTRQILLDLHKL